MAKCEQTSMVPAPEECPLRFSLFVLLNETFRCVDHMLKKVDIQAGRVALNLSPSMAVKTAEQPSLCQIPCFSP